MGQTRVSADTGTRAHKALHAKLGEVGCCLEAYGPDQISSRIIWAVKLGSQLSTAMWLWANPLPQL